jgi:hypothetical protein
MSDVPELDKLLEDHHIFKQNIAWERNERWMMLVLRLVLAVCMTGFAMLGSGYIWRRAVPVRSRVLR